MTIKAEDIAAFKKAFLASTLSDGEAGDGEADARDKGAAAKDRLDRLVRLVGAAVPGIGTRLAPELTEARKLLLRGDGAALNDRLGDIEATLDDWTRRVATMRNRLEPLRARMGKAPGDVSEASRQVKAAAAAIEDFDELAFASAADAAERLLDLLDVMAGGDRRLVAAEVRADKAGEGIKAHVTPVLVDARALFEKPDAAGFAARIDEAEAMLDVWIARHDVLRARLDDLRKRSRKVKGDPSGVQAHLDEAEDALHDLDAPRVTREADAAEAALRLLEAMTHGKARLAAAEKAAKGAVPGIARAIGPQIEAARALFAEPDPEGFADRMDAVEASLKTWLASHDALFARLKALQDEADKVGEAAARAQTRIQLARDALMGFDEARVAALADEAEGLLMSLRRIAAASDEDRALEVARMRRADAIEDTAMLAPFDHKLGKVAKKMLHFASECIRTGDAPGAALQLDAVEARLAAAANAARAQLTQRIGALRDGLDGWAGDAADLGPVRALLDDADKAVASDAFARAKDAADQAGRMVMRMQDAREIDLSKGLRKAWSKAISDYEGTMAALEVALARVDAPETQLLVALGVSGWIAEPAREVERAIRSLEKIPGGPSGRIARMAAVARFREAREVLTRHPAVDVIRKNPLGVTFATQGIEAAFDAMEKEALDA